MITLLDGRIIDPAQISFDPATYLFTLDSEDITALISRADKLANWPQFDPVIDNTRLSTGNPAIPLNSSVASIFIDRLETDPLDAPLDAAANAFNTAFAAFGRAADKALSGAGQTAANSPGIQALEKVVILAVISFVIYQGIAIYRLSRK